MKKRLFIALVAVFVISSMLAGVSLAAEKESFGTRVKNFWKNLVGYPGRITEESATVIADTTKSSA